MKYYNNNKPFIIAVGIFLGLFLLITDSVLRLNSGNIMLTLDDPYIHLALAENILKGHYGVNLGEASAPSSSIIWPFIIAPLTLFSNVSWALLVVNGVLAVYTIHIASRIIKTHIAPVLGDHSNRAQLVLITVFFLASNVLGLVWVGMEHSLQVLLAVLIAEGLIKKAEGHNCGKAFWLAVILIPLVRYESILISAVALLYCFILQDYKKSTIAGALIVFVCLLFSYFLISQGLQYLPDSILAKSTVAASGMSGIYINFTNNFTVPMTLPKAIGFSLLMMLFITYASKAALQRPKRILAVLMLVLIVLQLCFGRIGWFFRYEMATWALCIVVLAYLWASERKYKQEHHVQSNSITFRLIAGYVGALAILEASVVVVLSPLAASNVYHQQYQMHRFITEIYQKPVAVNDLGWTSLRNDNYVLDFWGLGSSRARILRQTQPDMQWMDTLADEKNVQLVMIYTTPNWFPKVPEAWVKVATLDITGAKVTAQQEAAFFVRRADDAPALKQQLRQFDAMLPQGSLLTILGD